MKEQKKAPKNRKSLILRLCVFAFAVYAAIALAEMQSEITARRQMLDSIRQSNEVQRIINKDLRRRVEAGMDEETIERLARERLDFAYPDEKVFIDISGS